MNRLYGFYRYDSICLEKGVVAVFPKNSRILIVDDMNMFRQMVRQALQALEFKSLVEANDGATAFPTLAKAIENSEPFNLVISDWNMPKMKGIDLLKKVREQTWGKNLPFIMLTAEAEKENIVQALQAGVDGYIIKPFSIDAMRTKLTQVYEKVNKAKPLAS